MTATPTPTAAETLADMILRAAGSGLKHYTPANRAAIIKAAEAAIDAIITSQTKEPNNEV